MARKKKRDVASIFFFEDISEETKRGIWSILFFVAALFFVLARFNMAGPAGRLTYQVLLHLFGIGYILLPIVLLALSGSLLIGTNGRLGGVRSFGAILFFVSGLGLIDLIIKEGGLVGHYVALPFVKFMDTWATGIIFVALSFIAILIVLNVGISTRPFERLWQWIHPAKDDELEYEEVAEEDSDEYEEEGGEHEEVGYEETDGDEVPRKGLVETATGFFKKDSSGGGIDFFPIGASYTPPPLSLFESDKGKPGYGDVKVNTNIIKRTLQNFGIQVEMDEVSIGPTVTRYALKPAEGVRLSKIVGLQNNLELALAAHPVRIEAPIPGKALVGIEVPNSSKAMLGLATIFGAPEFNDSTKPLMIALGKDITGQSHFANLAKMPHLLIAGATGSGKSVTIHNIISSLLYRNGPVQMRLIMVDPKRVELTLYNSIPHLLTPVITDAKKAVLSLNWAAKEMARRYDVLEAESVRDVESYHKNILAPALEKYKKHNSNELEENMESLPETMPYIVIIIDELADLMQSYPREVEAAVVRLAQMSRAVGIHLILSTQRPSVNIITGLIKANIPARVALQVASQIDSRTILDSSGAEKLLGAGDMLFISGEMSKPCRIQAPFTSEKEVKSVVKFIANNHTGDETESIEFSSEKIGDGLLSVNGSGGDANDDELYEEAREIVVHAGKASTSYLQRKLRVGYARAARLMDILEERGVIGPADGSKPREVIEQLPQNEEGFGERSEI